MRISRRNFVAYSSGILCSFIPFFSTQAKFLKRKYNPQDRLLCQPDEQRVVVIIHLAGGNDWLNTVIPYRDAGYYDQRPNLAISPQAVLKLDDKLAFHPALSGLKGLYDRKDLAVLLNVGNAKTSLSHQKANKLWQYGDESCDITWQGRYADFIAKNERVPMIFPAINVQPGFCDTDSSTEQIEYFPKSKDKIVISSLSADNNFEFNLDVHYKLTSSGCGNSSYGSSNHELAKLTDVVLKPALTDRNVYHKYCGFAHGMNLIGKAIKEGTNATIYNISLGGFDTHANQLFKHAALLNMLSKAVADFQNDMERSGLADKVLTLVCSEFGRSQQENNNLGTDHGYINHVLAIGNSVNGGIYGNRSLSGYSYNKYGQFNNSPKYDFDYRQLPATILDRWLSYPSEVIMGRSFAAISFI